MKEFISSALKKVPKMSEEQLRDFLKIVTDEYTLFRDMIDSINTGLILIDKNNEIVKINRASERIIGIRITKLCEKKAWDCIDCEKISDFIKNVITNEESSKTELFVLGNKDESLKAKYVEVSVIPLVSDKKITGTIVILEDVTREKHDEIQRHRLEGLASLTNVAATVAHEIKNPLGAMSIHAQLLKKQIDKIEVENKEKIEKHLSVIEEEIIRLNDIVVDFLFAVRPLKFSFDSVDINETLRSLSNLYKAEFEELHIAIEEQLEENLHHIWGDERFLRQAFINIITNAKAAMSLGGMLRIQTYQKNDNVLITFDDTGNGISQENIHQIFEPYFTTKANGTGLGLTMTYKVIKAHGGDIFVHSDESTGTSFVISLPILRKQERLLIENSATNESYHDYKTNKEEKNEL